uniref:Reverse transcriptase/retrotransposon-derived protein RNase H-like domain-containing protein n=1 Tax=Moniliophthora roreri TaxID=221103 RepID=A0A0W0EV84_MONRR
MLQPHSNGSAQVNTSSSCKPPCLLAGKLTLHNIRHLETSAKAWLRSRKTNVDVDQDVNLAADLHLGWLANASLLDWYLANSSSLDTLSLSTFFDRIRERFLGDTWAYDLAWTIDTMTQDRSTLFREFAENVVSTNNMHLHGHTPFLTDAVLYKPRKATELEHHIVNNTGDPTVDSLQAWILLVHEIDEDHYSRLGELHAAIAAADQRGLKQSTEVAGIGKSAAAVAATPQWVPPCRDMNSRSSSQWMPPSSSDATNQPLVTAVDFQTHTSTCKGETPICPTPPGDGNILMATTPLDEGEFPALANRLHARVAAVPVPSGYVTQVQCRKSFPPWYLPIASSSVVGVEDRSFGSDYNTLVEDSPPTRYVKSKVAPPSPLALNTIGSDHSQCAATAPLVANQLRAAAVITGEVNEKNLTVTDDSGSTSSSDSFEEHECHLRLILEALRGHRLYCNKKKSDFFIFELHFLGHVISTRGIEPDESKVARIKSWPTPQSPGDVWAFLGLTRYFTSFLRNLAEHTRILSPLTSLQDHEWPGWSQIYSDAFTSIKDLVTSAECLTVIDHDNPGDNKIWLTTDASDWRTGAVLSWGAT